MKKGWAFIASCVILWSSCQNTADKKVRDANPVTEESKVLTTLKEVEDMQMSLFNKGLRLETTDGTNHAVYVLFGKDSLNAELYECNKDTIKMWKQRTLYSGKHAWSKEENDAVNLHYTDGRWLITDREKVLYAQLPNDNDIALGAWNEVHYEGILPAADCPGIRYQVYVRHREHSGDGYFLLRLTYLEAEQGKDVIYTYMGRRYTLRGTATDNDATVWRLVVDGDKDNVYNFLYGPDGETLTYLNNNFEEIQSGLNYTLKRVD